MPLTTINASKDLELSHQPLILATLTMSDGTIRRLSTHPLAASEGGYTYGGNTYYGRILSMDLGPLEGYFGGGIEMVPAVTLECADPDKVLWLEHRAKGYRGASLSLVLVLWDAGTSTFSSDSRIVFTGIAENPQATHDKLSLSATSKMGMAGRRLPTTPVQRRCPWNNPTTTAERATADDEDSPYYRCGETRDLVTAPPCDYTFATCTKQLNFGGVTFNPSGSAESREYVSGKRLTVTANPNLGKYGSPVPIVFGTAWVNAIPLHVIPDGNSYRGEAIICEGDVGGILRLHVNDIELQAANSLDGGAEFTVIDPLLRYSVINRGDRVGSPNLDAGYDGLGDPYGSMCAVMWVLPRQAMSDSIPRVRALVQGPKIRVYSDEVTYANEYTSNPAWIILRLLVLSGWEYSDLDIESFIDAAAVCDESITYTDQYGDAAATRARYSCSLVLDAFQPADRVIRAVRLGCGMILSPDSTTGKIRAVMLGTLAAQQPAEVDGSNYDTPIASKTRGGSNANGYAAYDFAKQILDSFRVVSRGDSDLPSRVTIPFINSARDWAADSVSVTDVQAVARGNQEQAVALEGTGINTLDQAVRFARRHLAELNRGNPRLDAGGTERYQWTDTFRGVGIHAGDIVRLSDAQFGVSNQLVRVEQIRPATDWETADFVGSYHRDAWWQDSWGLEDEPETTFQRRNRLERPSFPWSPGFVQPAADDPLYDETDYGFDLTEAIAADGTRTLYVTGLMPVNVFPADLPPPDIGRQGTTASSGGTVKGSRACSADVCSIDDDGNVSTPSQTCQIEVTAVGNTNTITVPVAGWPSTATGYHIYCGDNPFRKTFQAAVTSSTPATITLTNVQENFKGEPDVEFDRFSLQLKRVHVSGVRDYIVSAVATNTITVDAAWTSDEWQNRTVSIIGRADGGTFGIQNYSVTSNTTGGVLTVSPDPSGVVEVGDKIVIRVATTTGATYVQDAKLAMTTDEYAGDIVRVIGGAGRGTYFTVRSNTATRLNIQGPAEWVALLGSTSIWIVEEPGWAVVHDGGSQSNAYPDQHVSISIDVTNYVGITLLVAGYTLDAGGNLSYTTYTPMREYAVLEAIEVPLAASDIVNTPAGTVASTDVQAAINELDTDKVATTRTIATGIGLAGGGNLSADRTLTVVANTTNQQVAVAKAGTTAGTRAKINFIEGSNVTLTVADNFGSDRVDVTIASSGGGGGDSTTTGVIASAPSPSNNGDLYFTSDSPYYGILRDTGAAYGYWGPMWKLTPPDALMNWTVLNQEEATIEDYRGAIRIVIPVDTAAGIRGFRKTAPSAPYVVTVGLMWMPAATDGSHVCAGWRQSSDGKLAVIRLMRQDSSGARSTKYTDESTISADYPGAQTVAWMTGPIHWLQLEDDTSNRIVRYSTDASNWIQLHSVDRTDFLIGDQIVFGLDTNGSTVCGAYAVLVHWSQA